MNLRSFVPLATVLALAACGEEQTAEAPATPPTTTETAEAPVTPVPPSTTAPAPTAPAATATAPAESTGTVTAAPPSTQTAATSPTSLDAFQGRTYSAGAVSLQLNPDNTFVMNEVDGNRKVEGRYAFENGVLTFSDPQGDVGPATFPMRCRFETTGASDFRLADSDGACTRFKDLTFKPAAG